MMSKQSDIARQFDLPERQSKLNTMLREEGLRDEQVYCICRSSDVSRFMIGCDHCEEWYHGDCINVTETEATRIRKFYCKTCQEKNATLQIKYKETRSHSHHSDKHHHDNEKHREKDRHKHKPYSSSKSKSEKRKDKCGECEACYVKEDCGRCEFCKDMPKFGGFSKLKQKCKKRQCLNFFHLAKKHQSGGSKSSSNPKSNGDKPSDFSRNDHSYNSVSSSTDNKHQHANTSSSKSSTLIITSLSQYAVNDNEKDHTPTPPRPPTPPTPPRPPITPNEFPVHKVSKPLQGKPQQPLQNKSHLPPLGKPHLPLQSKPHLPPQSKHHLPPQSKHHLPPQNKSQLPPQNKPQLPPQNKPQLPSQNKPQLPPQNKPQLPPQNKSQLPPQSKSHLTPQVDKPRLPPPLANVTNKNIVPHEESDDKEETDNRFVPILSQKKNEISDDELWQPKKPKNWDQTVAAAAAAAAAAERSQKIKDAKSKKRKEQNAARKRKAQRESCSESDDPSNRPYDNQLLRQCYGPQCIKPARPGSKYCSEECGLKLAEARIYSVLPQRIQEWKMTPCAAEELDRKQLEKIRFQQLEARKTLHSLDEKHTELDLLLLKSKAVAIDPQADEEGDDDGTEGAFVYCVTCGHEVPTRRAIRHMHSCYNKLESQMSFGSMFKTRIEGNNMFCDSFNASNRTYCKRLRVMCPEHTKEPKVSNTEVCGFPLTKNVFEETSDFCRVSKKKCIKHYCWEKLRRANIDMERVRQCLKLDELVEQERQVRVAMTNRAGVLGLMLHSTYDHEYAVKFQSQHRQSDHQYHQKDSRSNLTGNDHHGNDHQYSNSGHPYATKDQPNHQKENSFMKVSDHHYHRQEAGSDKHHSKQKYHPQKTPPHQMTKSNLSHQPSKVNSTPSPYKTSSQPSQPHNPKANPTPPSLHKSSNNRSPVPHHADHLYHGSTNVSADSQYHHDHLYYSNQQRGDRRQHDHLYYSNKGPK